MDVITFPKICKPLVVYRFVAKRYFTPRRGVIIFNDKCMFETRDLLNRCLLLLCGRRNDLMNGMHL